MVSSFRSIGILLLSALAASPCAAQRYVARELRAEVELPATGKLLNGRGQIAAIQTVAGAPQAVRLSRGSRLLGTGLPGDQESVSFGIGERGEVVGQARTDEGVRAILFGGAEGLKELGTLGGSTSAAYAVNELGVVVGAAHTSEDATHAFRWSEGKMQDLGTLGGQSSIAYGVNRRGQVVGEATDRNGRARAFRYTDGFGMQSLGALGAESLAYAINSGGVVVGFYRTEAGRRRAFIYRDRKGMQDLGTLPGDVESVAYDISDRGQVLGASFNARGDSRAFLYHNGRMIDLNRHLEKSALRLARARSMNDAGEILCESFTRDGKPALALLEPVSDELSVRARARHILGLASISWMLVLVWVAGSRLWILIRPSA